MRVNLILKLKDNKKEVNVNDFGKYKQEILKQLKQEIDLKYITERLEANYRKIGQIDEANIDTSSIEDISIDKDEGIKIKIEGFVKYVGYEKDENVLLEDTLLNIILDSDSDNNNGGGTFEDIKYGYVTNNKAYFIVAKIMQKYGYTNIVAFDSNFFEIFDDIETLEKFYDYKFLNNTNKNYIIKSFDKQNRIFIDIKNNRISEKEIMKLFNNIEDYYEFIGEKKYNDQEESDLQKFKINDVNNTYYYGRLIGILEECIGNSKDVNIIKPLIKLVGNYIDIYGITDKHNNAKGLVVINQNNIGAYVSDDFKDLVKKQFNVKNFKDMKSVLFNALKDNINKIINVDNIENFTELYNIYGEDTFKKMLGGDKFFYKILYIESNTFGFKWILNEYIYSYYNSTTIYKVMCRDNDKNNEIINALKVYSNGDYEETKLIKINYQHKIIYIFIDDITTFLLEEYDNIDNKLKKHLVKFTDFEIDKRSGEIIFKLNNNNKYLLKNVLGAKEELFNKLFIIRVYNLKTQQNEIKIVDEHMQEKNENLIDKFNLIEENYYIKWLIKDTDIIGYIEGKGVNKIIKILTYKNEEKIAIVKVSGANKPKLVDISNMKFIKPIGKKGDKIEVVLGNEKFYINKEFKLSKR